MRCLHCDVWFLFTYEYGPTLQCIYLYKIQVSHSLWLSVLNYLKIPHLSMLMSIWFVCKIQQLQIRLLLTQVHICHCGNKFLTLMRRHLEGEYLGQMRPLIIVLKDISPEVSIVVFLYDGVLFSYQLGQIGYF